MSEVEASWVARAEAALGGRPTEGVEVLEGQPPPVLDPIGVRAVLALPMAAFVWGAAVFRETVAESSFDPMALLLRLVALGLSVRAVVLGAVLVRRLRAASRRAGHRLALTDEGLLLRTPAGDFAVARGDVLAVKEHGVWQDKGTRRWVDVYVVTRPESGRTHLALPPFFERTPGVLAERLMRWLGAPLEVHAITAQPAELASKLYEGVARGERPPGVSVVEHGRGWLRRGPYATVLLGVVLLEGLLRLPDETRARLGLLTPSLLVLALVVVPLWWLAATRRHVAPRKGIALVLTPAELLLRTRGGVHRVRWSNVTRIELSSRRVWSLLEGAHAARTLVIHDREGGTVRYAEAFLGAPAEVVMALCDAYRKGWIAPAGADAA